MASDNSIRASDVDREVVVATLRDAYTAGRLTLEEFNQRLDAVFKATTQSQLNLLTRDLPHVGAPSAPLPVAGAYRERARQDD